MKTEKPKESKEPKVEFANLAYMLKRPYSYDIHRGPFQVKNKEEYRELLERAKREKLYVWYATVTRDDREKFILSHQHIVDWESIPDQAYDGVEAPKPVGYTPVAERTATRSSGDLICPVCEFKCSSTSGYTLHMKKHAADERAAEEAGDDALVCPVCKKVCSSTSGLTLHKQRCGKRQT